ncbi:hypothetical protein TWF696_008645 [Orbilia brochopaga]|uniref:Uncharacterized protein n=1 Tax=Orbilia brochopaga TaxID=3140254 RepID=A0AAV9UGS5_9PEZI
MQSHRIKLAQPVCISPVMSIMSILNSCLPSLPSSSSSKDHDRSVTSKATPQLSSAGNQGLHTTSEDIKPENQQIMSKMKPDVQAQPKLLAQANKQSPDQGDRCPGDNTHKPSSKDSSTPGQDHASQGVLTRSDSSPAEHMKSSEQGKKDIVSHVADHRNLQSKGSCAGCRNDISNVDLPKGKPRYCYRCLHRIVRRQEKELDSMYEKVERLKHSLDRSKQEVTAKAQEVEDREAFIKELSQDHEKLKADFHQNESEIRSLQRKELATNRQDEILTDEQARNDIHQILQTKVHKISRLFFRKVPWQNLAFHINGPLWSEVSWIFIIPWNPTSMLSDWHLIQSNPHITAHTFVDALISSTIVEVMFRRPFFLWDPNVGWGLHNTYLQSLEKDAKSAIAWKAKTTRLHNSLCREESQHPNRLHPRLAPLYDHSLRSLVNMVQTHRQLSEKDISDLDQALLDLLQSSAALAIKWHERDLHFHAIDFGWLQDRQIDWHSPDAAKYVTAFPRTEEFDDPHRKYRIVAVMSPGFIRYEVVSAGEPLQEIVWEKASVLLAELPVDTSAVSGNTPGQNTQH